MRSITGTGATRGGAKRDHAERRPWQLRTLSATPGPLERLPAATPGIDSAPIDDRSLWGSRWLSVLLSGGDAQERPIAATGTADQPLRSFEVVRPIPVESGTTAPWFGQAGGGIQYRAPITLDTLLRRGIIREAGP